MSTNVIKAAMFLVAAVAGAGAARAATVAFDLQVDPTARTFDVFATLSNDNRGLASFSLDVTGSGGVSITSSVNQSPRPFDATLNDFRGFRLFRTNGTNGNEVRASQDTTDSTADGQAKLIFDVGVTAPVRLASGTYTGDVGALTASLHPGASFNVFPTSYAPGGPTAAATAVTPETVVVPEPAGAGLLVMAAAGLLAGRRRRSRRQGSGAT